MRDTNLSQPEGCWMLAQLLTRSEEILSDIGVGGDLACYFKTSYVNDFQQKPELHRPSHNLMIAYNGVSVFVIQYELDTRFSLELSRNEIERVEDYMANEAIAGIGTYGILTCINSKMKKNMTIHLTLKESDDKKFLPLN